MTSDGSTLRHQSDIADEANALLGGAPLHRGDVRWLTGRLVHVLISPVEPSSDEMAVSLTLATTDSQPGGLGGLAIHVTDADGEAQSATLDDDGHALLLLTTDSYRLAVEAPFVAKPAVTSTIDMSDPVPVPVRVVVGAGRRAPHRPARRRPGRSAAAALWALPAAVVVLFATALVVVPKTPAGAEPVAIVNGRTCTKAARERANDGRHVEVVATWGNDEQERFKEVLEQFHETTKIRVTLANDNPDTDKRPAADRDLLETLDSRKKGGCRTGVALLPQTGLLKKLALENRLWPIENVAGREVNDNYSQAWRDLGSVRHRGSAGDTLYGVWFKASNKSLIWYNAAAFDRAGIAEPADWEGLKKAAGKLRAAGIPPFSVAGDKDNAWTLTDWFENVYLRTAGPKMYEELAAGTIRWTDPSVVFALGKLAEVFGPPGWLAGGAEGSLRTSFSGSVAKVFAKPQRPGAAMVFEGDFVATEVAKTRSKLGVDARSFPFPTIPPASPMGESSAAPTLVGAGAATAAGEATGGDVAVLLRDDRNPADPEAEELLRYLAKPWASERWIQAGGFLSPNKNATGYPNPAAQTAAANLANAESLSFDLSDRLPPAFGGTPGEGMWRVLQDFLRNPKKIDETAQQLQAEYAAATK